MHAIQATPRSHDRLPTLNTLPLPILTPLLLSSPHSTLIHALSTTQPDPFDSLSYTLLISSRSFFPSFLFSLSFDLVFFPPVLFLVWRGLSSSSSSLYRRLFFFFFSFFVTAPRWGDSCDRLGWVVMISRFRIYIYHFTLVSRRTESRSLSSGLDRHPHHSPKKR